MSKNSKYDDLVKSILSCSARLPDAKRFKSQDFDVFVRLYFSFFSHDMTSECEPKKSAQIAHSHWKFSQNRQKNQPIVKIFNPSKKDHGWVSEHTCVQIVLDDMPFLVDTARMMFDRHELIIHHSINTPQVFIKRTSNGRLMRCADNNLNDKSYQREAFIYFEIDKEADQQTLSNLEKELTSNLLDVYAAVNDWPTMQGIVEKQIDTLDQYRQFIGTDEIKEYQCFLRWLLDGNFIFLGARHYKKSGAGKSSSLRLLPHKTLGLLKAKQSSRIVRKYSDLPDRAKEMALSRKLLITMPETNTKSTVHRPCYTICIAIKVLGTKGEILGEIRLLGLYTSSAYHHFLKDIPILRQKQIQVLQKANFPRLAYAGKAVEHIIETLPRDELFQFTVDELYKMSIEILNIQEKKVTHLFVRKDIYNRYFSCFVFIPRDNFNAHVTKEIKHLLVREFDGDEVTFTTHFFETGLMRLHYVVRVDPSSDIDFCRQSLAQSIADIATSWNEKFLQAAIQEMGVEKGTQLAKRFDNAFPLVYQQVFSSRSSVRDAQIMNDRLSSQDIAVSVCPYKRDGHEMLSLKVYHKNKVMPLSEALPIMDNMGMNVITEVPYQIETQSGDVFFINDFHMLLAENAHFGVSNVRENVNEAFCRIWSGECENDSFNSLILNANVTWREVSVLRMYYKYLKQIGFSFAIDYATKILSQHPSLVRTLVKLFECRFRLVKRSQSEKEYVEFKKQFLKLLADVNTLDEDRVFRRFFQVIDATQRTNFYQELDKGVHKAYLSVKIHTPSIPDVPAPVPLYEFFVYSPQRKGQHSGFEGVHIRFSNTARGGIRLSRRREDYRREVLDLATTQQVKNAVIVPSGAKGGFVPYYAAGEMNRDAIKQESVACYRDYISGMLDLVDNIESNKSKHPPQTVCHDSFDSYFVVAADKGTATYSDEANQLSEKYSFWLGDGFASGGSEGYDHKKMGITAKGAWESVKHHFVELGINTDRDDFTVIGIGDMAGDVFGNGMLLSRHIRLVAAFNHLHIFIDPNPNADKSYQERQRLFEAHGSTWQDYSENLISPGGGVFSRSVKSIALSEEIKQLFGITKNNITPDELIKKILCHQADLLWNGGIGTYIKSSAENNDSAHDRSNDSVRVNANEVNCKVIAEGGNLGLTQQGRIEYEINGGRINTDFIDNSAGVDCSDHEVNIKIMLNGMVRDKKLRLSSRNALLRRMTNSVSALVLQNNQKQNKSITLASLQSVGNMGVYRRYMTFLEKEKIIHRKREVLPSDDELKIRQKNKVGFYRPEISVLVSKTKNLLKSVVLESQLTKDSLCQGFIYNAFPKVLCDKYPKEILKHKLNKQLVATQISNILVDEMGLIFVYQLHEETSSSMLDVVKVYLACRDMFHLDSIVDKLAKYESQVDATLFNRLTEDYVEFVKSACRWLLHSQWSRHHCVDICRAFKSEIANYQENIVDLISGNQLRSYKESLAAFCKSGISKNLSTQLASLPYLLDALKVIDFSAQYKKSIPSIANIHSFILYQMNISDLLCMVENYAIEDYWSAAAIVTLKKKLDHAILKLIGEILKMPGGSSTIKIKRWKENNAKSIEKWHFLLGDSKAKFATNTSQLATLSVVVDMLKKLLRSKRH